MSHKICLFFCSYTCLKLICMQKIFESISNYQKIDFKTTPSFAKFYSHVGGIKVNRKKNVSLENYMIVFRVSLIKHKIYYNLLFKTLILLIIDMDEKGSNQKFKTGDFVILVLLKIAMLCFYYVYIF